MIIRPALPQDAPAMADLLNVIIAIGGTTAHEQPKSADTMRHDDIERRGFTDIGAEPDYALSTGQVVGRVFRKLTLR